ncbi:MAG: outer membrane beta-barrel protein [Bdellovibrionales bacterium]|nr:outer membrane beta-barrel protein [Bdellovibrionales bacterium]
MKFSKNFALVLFLAFFSVLFYNQPSGALGFGIEGGFKQQSGDAPTGYSSSSQVGYQLGAIGFFDISDRLAIRSGLMYSQRPLKITSDTTNDSATIAMTYFDVPVGLMFKFEDYMGAYLGTGVSLNLDKSSDKKSVIDVVDAKSIVVPVQLGVTFKFMPDVGLDLYFEQFGEVAKDLKSYRSVGVNLLFSME